MCLIVHGTDVFCIIRRSAGKTFFHRASGSVTAGSGTKIYLAEDGTVSECTRDEIRENDKVILYYDYASLNMIVIQR